METITRSRSRISYRPLAICLAAALGLNLPAGAGTLSLPHAPRSAAGSMHGNAASRVRAARAASVPQLPAGDLRVTNCDDSGSGSLRDVASHASSTDYRIYLNALPCSTITLSSGAVNFGISSATLIGPGADKLTIAGNGADRVIGHSGNGTLAIKGVTLTGGVIQDSSGGCVYSAGSIVLASSVVSSCRAFTTSTADVLGGGVYARDVLNLEDSTITGNTVEGPAAHVYGGGAFVVGKLEMYGSTISNNVATGLVGNTGGVVALRNAVIHSSTIYGNTADYNAGVAVFGEITNAYLYVVSSTISGNVANFTIAGLGTLAPAKIYGSTIADNRDGGGSIGAGFFLGTGTHASVYRTIVADNYSGSARNDVGGYPGSSLTGSNDLFVVATIPTPPGTIFADPQLGPLQDNGGATLTHALHAGSPAIDQGGTTGLTDDQRGLGYARVVGNAVDIGAYEVQTTGTTRTIANCSDAGDGSLRDAVSHAVSGDVVDLSQLECSTITLTSGAIDIPQTNLTLNGPGLDRLTIDGNSASRVIDHTGPGTLTVTGMTLQNGNYVASLARTYGGCVYGNEKVVLDHVRVTSCQVTSTGNNVPAFGGGVYAFDVVMNASRLDHNEVNASTAIASGGGVHASYAVIRDSTIEYNVASSAQRGQGEGGGLFFDYHATISGSTISANQAGSAGALYMHGGEIVDSTISGNTAFFIDGGVLANYVSVYNSTIAFNAGSPAYDISSGVTASAVINVQSSILFGNANGTQAYDLGLISTGGVLVGAHDLIGASPVPLPPDTISEDPLLAPLAGNGGATKTHALQAGSPAIDAGSNPLDLDDDQRGSGFARVFGASADIGAFEVQISDVIFENGFD